MKITTGHYVIQYRNKYGARLIDMDESAPNLETAKAKGERRLFSSDDPEDSHVMPSAFTVDRRIYNSEDNR